MVLFNQLHNLGLILLLEPSVPIMALKGMLIIMNYIGEVKMVNIIQHLNLLSLEDTLEAIKL